MTTRLYAAPWPLNITRDALAVSGLSRKRRGAIVSFVGEAREESPACAGGVAAVHLEHYPGMTERSLETLEAEARARWPLLDVLLEHRTGRVAAGEPIVQVVVVSRHRAAAFDACSFLMDGLKTRAVFWKREEDASGTLHWVEATAEDLARQAAWD